MKNDFFEKNYPQINELYFDFINSDKYTAHPMVKFVEKNTTKALDEAVKFIGQGKEVKCSDALTEGALMYEQSGFILGFSIAMNFINESFAKKGSAV